MARDVPRFLFVDRIEAHEPGKWVRAEHVVSATYAAAAGPYRLLEALAQSAGWLIAASTGFAKRGLPISIASVRLPAALPAAATVLLEAEVISWREESALAKARASVEGTRLAEIERGICALIPADRLDAPETTRKMFARLAGDPKRRAAVSATRRDGWPGAPSLEEVSALDGGSRIRARWRIEPAARYFPDHFPRFPLVPGALQVQALVTLAASLFATEHRRPVLEEFTEARFRGFVRPGEELTIEAAAVSEAPDRAVATAEGFVAGKRVVSLNQIRFRLEPALP